MRSSAVGLEPALAKLAKEKLAKNTAGGVAGAKK